MRVLQLSSIDGGGGAGRAAYRLQAALEGAGVESRMWVDVKTTSDPKVTAPDSFFANLERSARIAAEQLPTVLAGQRGRVMATSARWGGLKAHTVNGSNADIVNLHWTGFGFMSIEEIGKVAKPMVWTMHDMWSFLGASHYESEAPDVRWRWGYPRSSARRDWAGRDLDRWTWRRKQRAWSRPQQLVAPSSWLAVCARESSLLSGWPVTVIPNPIDLEVYRPRGREQARDLLGLPQDVPLILFGVASGSTDGRKGWDLLADALPYVKNHLPHAEIVILSQERPAVPFGPEFPEAHWLGQLNDDLTLSLAYSAADVTVVPSRQDNLPQSGTEPQACGCPVVAFNTSGLPDVVEHNVTGYLARAFDPQELANGIATIAGNCHLRERLSRNARARAERLWGSNVVADQYRALYVEVLARHTP